MHFIIRVPLAKYILRRELSLQGNSVLLVDDLMHAG